MGVFEYLGEFWNHVSDWVVGGVTYSAGWFQQIGNAVAGAVGSILLAPFRWIVDFLLALAYILFFIYQVLVFFFQILTFFVNNVIQFFSAFSQPLAFSTYDFSGLNSITSALMAIPALVIVQYVLAGLIYVYAAFFIYRHLLH